MKRILKKALWNFKISITVFAIAAVLFFGSILWFNRIDWEPVNIPLRAMDEPLNAEFSPYGDVRYLVELEWDRSAASDYGIGSDDPLSACEANPDWMTVTWKVASEAGVVSEGIKCRRADKFELFSDRTMLTDITGASERRFQATVTVSGPAGIIERSHPRLVVRPSFRTLESELMGWFIRRGIAVMIAVAAAGFFILESLIVLIRYLVRRKKESSLVE